MMRETVELYELIARQTRLVKRRVLRSHAQPRPGPNARVNFAGTAVMESEAAAPGERDSETDIANGILRVSREATQRVWFFLAGHGEADPFSLESTITWRFAPVIRTPGRQIRLQTSATE